MSRSFSTRDVTAKSSWDLQPRQRTRQCLDVALLPYTVSEIDANMYRYVRRSMLQPLQSL